MQQMAGIMGEIAKDKSAIFVDGYIAVPHDLKTSATTCTCTTQVQKSSPRP